MLHSRLRDPCSFETLPWLPHHSLRLVWHQFYASEKGTFFHSVVNSPFPPMRLHNPFLLLLLLLMTGSFLHFPYQMQICQCFETNLLVRPWMLLNLLSAARWQKWHPPFDWPAGLSSVRCCGFIQPTGRNRGDLSVTWQHRTT